MIKIFTIGLKKERAYLIENLALLSESGMGLVASLLSISKDIRSQRLKKIIEEITKTIEQGSALWRALSKHPELFPEHSIALIRIGEETGRLAENLEIVANQEAKNREFKAKLRSAMMYPLFVLGVTGIVGIGIAWFILPQLAVVFSQLDVKLPLITKILIAIGEFLQKYGIIAVPVFALCVCTFFYILFFAPKTKHIGQRILFALPGTKKLMQEAELSSFGYLLGTLLSAGLTITSAMDSVSRSTTNILYGNLYAHLKTQIEAGHSLNESFSMYAHANRLVPTTIQQMVTAGEQSGALSRTLIRIGENFENKMDITMKNLSVILEPLLLIIVWAGVVGVALAVIFPIYSLIGQFNP